MKHYRKQCDHLRKYRKSGRIRRINPGISYSSRLRKNPMFKQRMGMPRGGLVVSGKLTARQLLKPYPIRPLREQEEMRFYREMIEKMKPAEREAFELGQNVSKVVHTFRTQIPRTKVPVLRDMADDIIYDRLEEIKSIKSPIKRSELIDKMTADFTKNLNKEFNEWYPKRIIKRGDEEVKIVKKALVDRFGFRTPWGFTEGVKKEVVDPKTGKISYVGTGTRIEYPLKEDIKFLLHQWGPILKQREWKPKPKEIPIP